MTNPLLASAIDLLDRAARVVTFSGAGLSAESGVATFRDAKTEGLWTTFDPTRLASPEGFADDPQLVINWYADRRRALADAQPNPAHRAMADRRDVIHVTQNVDDLLHRAGADPARVIQLQGTIARDRGHGTCVYESVVDLVAPPGLHDCPNCGAPMRPAVVWFGEALPADAWLNAERACAECDVLLVVGTSAEVYPAAGLISLAKGAGAAVVIVNTNPSGASHLADIELIGPAGEIVPALLRSR